SRGHVGAHGDARADDATGAGRDRGPRTRGAAAAGGGNAAAARPALPAPLRARRGDAPRSRGARHDGGARGVGPPGGTMTLATLLRDVDVDAVRGPTDREVSGLCHDSRRLSPGAVFFGLAGLHQDGARFARQALAAGAAAVVVARGSAIDGATVVE